MKFHVMSRSQAEFYADLSVDRLYRLYLGLSAQASQAESRADLSVDRLYRLYLGLSALSENFGQRQS